MSPYPLTYRLWRLALAVFGAGGLVLALLWLLGQPVPVARAGSDWYVDPAGDDGHTCTSAGPATACRTIGGAAGKASPGDTIYIAAGTYPEHVSISGKVLTFVGAGMSSTIVDGGGTGRMFITGSDITLANLTIQHGSAGWPGGGGLYTNGALTLTNVAVLSNTTYEWNGGGAFAAGAVTIVGGLFQNNTAICGGACGSGGGLYAGGSLALTDAQFFSNTAYGGGGANAQVDATLVGGLFQGNSSYVNGGGLRTSGALTLIGTQFISNTSTAYSGGGAYIGGAVNLSGGLFQNNSCAGNGGGLGTEATLALTGTQFIGNTAGGSGGGGGGAFARNGATLSGGIFQDNRCTAPNCVGGGLFSYGNLTLADTQFIGNAATAHGGGAYAHPDPATGRLSGGLFQNNQSGGSGGGLYVDGPSTIVSGTQFVNNTAASNGGGLAANGALNLSGVPLGGNTATGSGGGAYAAGAASITGGLIQNNQGGSGGGLFTEHGLAVAGAQFIGNTSQSNGGGALANGAATVSGSLFQDNICTGAGCVGGGLYEFDGLTLTTTRFINNAAAYGGGVFDRNFNNSGRIVNTLFARNSARTGGSAMYLTGNTVVQFTTVASPTLGESAAIYVDGGIVNIADTLIARYTTGVQQAAGTVSEDYNLFYGNTTDKAGTMTGGANDVSGDPLFVNPAGEDYHLAAGSAAIDKGTDVSVTTDLDGNVRPFGSGYDIGAYEFVGGKLSQTITFPEPPNKTITDSTAILTATASSGLPVTFTTNSPAICSIAGNTATLLAGGLCSVTAHQAGDATYDAAPDVTQAFNIYKVDQTINFGALPDKTLGDPPFNLTATATSGLAVTFTTTSTTVCSVSGSQVTLLNGGRCFITAHQAGDATYNPAPDVTQSFKVTGAAILYAVPGGLTSGACDAWAAACDLQVALAQAGSGTEIWAAAGTYVPTPGTDRQATFQLKNGVALYGGFAGAETDRSQRDPAANVTILSGEIGAAGPDDNSYHVVTGSGTDHTAILDGFTITAGNANGASADCGAGMYNTAGSPTLTNVSFSANSATVAGGGMYNYDHSNPTLTNVTFSANHAGNEGGGMYNINNHPTLTNVTFNANSAGSRGGGMANLNSDPTLTNVTIHNNTSPAPGAGMYNYLSNPILNNCIVWYNPSSEMYNDSSTPVISDTIILDGCPRGSICSHVITANPRLGPIGTYGGSMLVYPLLPDSPAIDSGNDATCAASDQRGIARPQGAHCDIGAFESRGFALAITGGDNQTARLGLPFSSPLSVSVSSASGEPVDGGEIDFTAPHSNPTTAVPIAWVNIASGAAAARAVAGDTAGSYTVTASATGVAVPVIFHLTNAPIATLFAKPGGLTSGACDAWGDACDLQYALTTALPGSELWVAAGTYLPTAGSDRTATFQLKSRVAVYGGFAGTETDRSQRDPAVNVTVLSGEIGALGSGDNCYHVVSASGTDYSAALDGFTITGGNADGGAPDDGGGGMVITNGIPILSNLIFITNTAAFGGGLGIHNGGPRMDHITFRANTASADGGGIESSGGGLDLTNATFEGNSATKGGGFANGDGSAHLTNVTFISNTAVTGGGMANENASQLILENASFSLNSATNNGGGLYNSDCDATLSGVTFSSNHADDGGGLYNDSSSSTLSGVIFSGNSAAHDGGGMWGGGDLSGNPVTLERVSFSGNWAAGEGGGLYADHYSLLTNITFSTNSARRGGGMAVHGRSALKNATFYGNDAFESGGGMYLNGALVDVNNCILWHDTFQGHPGAEVGTLGNSEGNYYDSVIEAGCPNPMHCWGVSFKNPLLGAPGTYGGSMLVYPLLPGSSAIDAGNDAKCYWSDQRGFNRVGAHCDIGAFESQGFTLTVTSGDNQSALSGSPFAQPLAVNVSSTYSEPVDGGTISYAVPNYHGNPGPTARLDGSTRIIASGAVSVTGRALGIGPFVVMATTTGALAPAIFHLTDLPNRLTPILFAKPGGLDYGYCDSWAGACDLQVALLRAYPGTEIWAAAGTYTPTSFTDRQATFQLKNGVALYGGFTGTETDRSQRDPAANVTILSGEIGAAGPDDNSYHVVTGSGTDHTAILDGFTITAGNANGASANGGAGMYNTAGSPTLTNVTFSANSATEIGGGMYNYDHSNPTLTNVTFSANSADWGGGMYNYYHSNPTLTNVTFSANSTDLGGGGMYNINNHSTLNNVTFSANSASLGGGMYNMASSPALTNVTFSRNSATVNGGGMLNDNISNPTIRNSLLWGNTASTGPQIQNLLGSAPTIAYSDVQGGCPAGSTCSDLLSTDPLLGPIGTYGGSTQVYPLLPGSPAIDAGDDATCAASDQRGMTRPQAAHCDIGAFESRGFNLAVSGGDPQSAGVTAAFDLPLELDVSSAYGEPVDGGKISFRVVTGSGAGAGFTGNPAAIVDSHASVTAIANSTAGSYLALGDASGAAAPAAFHLTNRSASSLFATPSGATSGPCDSLAHACDLQYVLGTAPAGTEIWVTMGVYKPAGDSPREATFQLKNGVEVYGGFTGTETSRSQRDPAAHPTTLSCDIGAPGTADNCYHVVTGSGTDLSAVLDGFTITGGNANDAAAPNNQGGGMYSDSGSPRLVNITFSGNQAALGGGVYITHSSPLLVSVVLTGNSASSYGGAMYTDSGSSPILIRTTFSSNSAGLQGGGMFNSGSDPILNRTTFSGNTSAEGGGMYNSASSPTLLGSTFSANTADNGGGMYNVESSPALTKTTFSANTAGNGGGLYNDSGSPTLTNVTFSANTASSGGAGPLGGVSAASTAGSGGGLYNNYGSPTLTNVTFSGNMAGSLGGGMYNLNSLSPSLANVTFSANNAGEYGGGLYNDNSYPTVLNSILWGNTAVSGTQIYNFYSTPSLAYSDVQGGCPDGAACSNLISSDPLLGPLGTYGGGPQVFPLLPGSPAIDAGDDATCALTDQRNVSRWQGMRCDMGAFESRGFGLSITSGDGQTTHIRRAFALPLVLSVSSAYGEPVDGGVIRFNLPASGPSAALSLNTVTISGGAVSVTATANNASGKYTVAAGGQGGLNVALFHLANILYQVNLPLIVR